MHYKYFPGIIYGTTILPLMAGKAHVFKTRIQVVSRSSIEIGCKWILYRDLDIELSTETENSD
jgi:hypothetical protein